LDTPIDTGPFNPDRSSPPRMKYLSFRLLRRNSWDPPPRRGCLGPFSDSVVPSDPRARPVFFFRLSFLPYFCLVVQLPLPMFTKVAHSPNSTTTPGDHTVHPPLHFGMILSFLCSPPPMPKQKPGHFFFPNGPRTRTFDSLHNPPIHRSLF